MWNIKEDRPIWTQLSEQIAERIVSGAYGPGSRLPSVRDLAAEAGVNPNTMQRAMSQLEAEGLVLTNRTAGRTVTEDMEAIGKMRKELVKVQIEEFVNKMKNLGFSREDIWEALSGQFQEED